MKMKDNDWSRNGKGDKPRTKTWERQWQEITMTSTGQRTARKRKSGSGIVMTIDL